MASGTVASEGKWYSRMAHAISTAVTNKISRAESVFPEEKCYGKYPQDMPTIRVAPLSSKLQSAATGPNAGLCQLDAHLEIFPNDGKEIAGIKNWQNGKNFAEGVCTSLYDRIPGKSQHNGDPVADVFGVVSFENSAILAIADGVNWGHKPRLAARCAINGAMTHIIDKLYVSNSGGYPNTTHDIFHTILRSFEVAQQLIIDKEATTTTLCIAVICELMPTKGPTRWGCCLVCLGDSLGYVYRQATGLVEELTSFSHDDVERDMRNCGGCLGPHIGIEPDIENLFCVFSPVAERDVVFLTTDGVSDNFDPVVRKEALPSPLPNSRSHGHDSDSDTSDKSPTPHEETLALPFLTPLERHNHSLKLMTNVIRRFSNNDENLIDATNVAANLVTDTYCVTEKQRSYLEEHIPPNDCTPEERRESYREIKRSLKRLPGKLDHATVVAYQVLQLGESCVLVQQPKKQKVVPKTKSFDHTPNRAYDVWTQVEYDSKNIDPCYKDLKSL